jgi:6,7-dimethyl-8-ribityllumazine synthase
MAQKDIERNEPDLNGSGLRIGIVVGRFNREVGEALLAACTAALTKQGVRASDIRVVTVPGALEVPLALQKMANTGHFDALVALGAVIRGETYHFEVVSNESAAGLSSVALEFGIPIGNGILTCETDAQAEARMDAKGFEAAQAALEMANLFAALDDD